LLGDVPLLGKMFRREVREQFKTELVLLITPHVFTTVDEAEQRGRERLESLSDHYYLEE
jgi:general secretion pathway protein D